MTDKITPSSADVLVVVDVQNDFCPGGSLAVPDGDKIVPIINRIARHFENVVLTQDWHPRGHHSFASSHLGKHPLETRSIFLWSAEFSGLTIVFKERPVQHSTRISISHMPGSCCAKECTLPSIPTRRSSKTIAAHPRDSRAIYASADSHASSWRDWHSTSAFAIRQKMLTAWASACLWLKMRAEVSMSKAPLRQLANVSPCSELPGFFLTYSKRSDTKPIERLSSDVFAF